MNFTPMLSLFLLPLLAPSSTPQVVATSLSAAPSSLEATAFESEVQLYDLRSLGTRRQYGGGSLYLAPASVTAWDDEDYEEYAVLDSDQIMSILERLCGDEFEFEGRAMWSTQSGVLAVRAPAAVQARVAALLELIASSLGSRVEVRVDILNHDSRVRVDDSLLGVIDPEDADSLRRSATSPGVTMQSYTLNVVPGGSSLLDLTHAHEIIGWYEIEVAQSSFAFDPVVVELLSGTRLSMNCSPIAGGLGMSLIMRSGDPTGPPERVDLLQKGFASNENSRGYIEGPRYAQSMSIASRSIAFDAAIPTGKALAFQSTLNVDAAQGTQVVLIQPQGKTLAGVYSTATTGSQPDVFVVNMDAFATPELEFHGEASWRAATNLRLDRMFWYEEPLLAVRHGEVDRESGWEYLQSQCPDLEFEEAHNWIVATRDASAARDMKESGVTPTPIDEAVSGIMQRPEWVQVSLNLARAGEGVSKGVSCDLPLRVGRQSSVTLGVEGTKIGDFDVEIAQGSTANAPIARLYLDGMLLMLEPRRSPNGDLSLRLRGIAQLMRERSFFEPNSPMFRGLDQFLFDRLTIDQTVTLEGGKGSVTLGDSSSNAGVGSLRLDLEVR